MSQINKLKIFNDPIYGFITIPNALIYDLIQHPYFQRLRRISQMGLSYLVYPGANHTRFHHALGCMHLMQKAVDVLRFKGVQYLPRKKMPYILLFYCTISVMALFHMLWKKALSKMCIMKKFRFYL